jgi:endoglucanase
MEATGDGPLNVVAWQEYIDWMETRKLSCITWSISSKDETCSMLNKSANTNGNWFDQDIRESGKLIIRFLKKYNNKK